MNKRKWHARTLSAKTLGFTEADKEQQRNAFLAVPENRKMWERLEETKERLPWTRHTVESLQNYVEAKGVLTDKQRSYATSLYLDCCMTPDDKIIQQVEARKTCFRLLNLELGRVKPFIDDIIFFSDTHPFTAGQLRAVNNISKRLRAELTKIPKLDSEMFDGWFLKPENPVDK